MALVKTEGIILRSKKYSETSLILDIYTQLYGLRSYIVSGVRKSRSKSKAGIYQVMNIINLVAYDKQNNALSRITEAHPKHIYKNISRDVIKSSVGMLLMEVTRNAIKEKEQNLGLYDFLIDWFLFLDQTQDPVGNLTLKYLLDLSAKLGFKPRENYSEETPIFDTYEGQFINRDQENKYCIEPDLSLLVFTLTQSHKSEIHQISANRTSRAALLDKLIQFYQLHLDNFKDLKSISILRQVLS